MSIQVVDRLTRLLDVIAEQEEAVSLKDLAAATELHPSTAFRILASLADHEFVERSESGHYRLGVKLLQLGSRVQGRLDIRREAEPIIEWLCQRIDETVNLIIREGDEVVYVGRATPSRMMRVEQAIGGHMPLHVTAVGKLFLAEGGAKACSEYAERSGLHAATRYSITNAETLWQTVEQAMRQGFALDDQEAELGVGCIGVPVRDNGGHMVAGVSVSAPFDRRDERWVPIVQQAGTRLSIRLGFSPRAAATKQSASAAAVS